MTSDAVIQRKELRNILIANWMTHDALWYGEVAAKLGMAEASPMNLRVCRRLGQIEFRRAMKMVGASPPQNRSEYLELFELATELFVPEFMRLEVSYPSETLQVFDVLDCFAHRGLTKQGLIGDYQCGIFERIEGWLDAMGVRYTRTPDLNRCLKFKGEKCRVIIECHFDRDGPSANENVDSADQSEDAQERSGRRK